MSNPLRLGLTRQLDLAWKLAEWHLDTLTTAECLWRPAPVGLHVRQEGNGLWRADWPEHEGYDLGPPSIAWLSWHIGYWWSMTLDHNFGDATLTRDAVFWPGDAAAVREWIAGLYSDWRTRIDPLTDEDLHSQERTRWPYRNRPFGDVLAWLNVELAKNAAEIGFARFLYAARAH